MRSQAVDCAALYPRPDQFQIYELGPPHVAWNGCVFPIARSQVRACLYYLANNFRPATRDEFCGLFWDHYPDCNCKRNLSHLLTHLRAALPDGCLVKTPDDQIFLDGERCWSDVAAFETVWSQGVNQQHAALVYAYELYRGPFMAGFYLREAVEFDGWVAQRQRELEQQYLMLLTRLIMLAMAQGQLDQAIQYAQRYLAVDDLNEAIHRYLIELYMQTGHRSAALQQYKRCVTLLHQEFGIQPCAKTQQAYQSALQGCTSRTACQES